MEDAADKAIRLQWAASLLFAFHDFEQADFTYRAAVDTLLNMIENRTMKQSFLVVVRDFHRFGRTLNINASMRGIFYGHDFINFSRYVSVVPG